jgi:hypothetical protein
MREMTYHHVGLANVMAITLFCIAASLMIYANIQAKPIAGCLFSDVFCVSGFGIITWSGFNDGSLKAQLTLKGQFPSLYQRQAIFLARGKRN